VVKNNMCCSLLSIAHQQQSVTMTSTWESAPINRTGPAVHPVALC